MQQFSSLHMHISMQKDVSKMTHEKLSYVFYVIAIKNKLVGGHP